MTGGLGFSHGDTESAEGSKGGHEETAREESGRRRNRNRSAAEMAGGKLD